MKCPICASDMRAGKCTFCGYVQTAYDRDARDKYEAQKRALSGGPETKDVRAARRAVRKPDKPRRPDVEKPVETVEKPKPAARSGPGCGTGPPGKPGTRPPGKQPDRTSGDRSGTKNRPGFLKRFLFKALVIGWILAYILAVCGRISQLAREREDGRGSYENGDSIQASSQAWDPDPVPGEGGQGRHAGN